MSSTNQPTTEIANTRWAVYSKGAGYYVNHKANGDGNDFTWDRTPSKGTLLTKSRAAEIALLAKRETELVPAEQITSRPVEPAPKPMKRTYEVVTAHTLEDVERKVNLLLELNGQIAGPLTYHQPDEMWVQPIIYFKQAE